MINHQMAEDKKTDACCAQLLEHSLAGNIERVKELLEVDSPPTVDCTDATGMTPLHQAAFRGNPEMVSYLLSKGANVNSDSHENGYTALMFGALSGNQEVVSMLLEAGADIDKKNSVNRTAAEMAGFVSQHHIVGLISNFLHTKTLEKFTQPTGLEERAKLKTELLVPLHKLIIDSNLNPIHILKSLEAQPGLLEDSRYIKQILYKLCMEKMGAHDTHESLALKLHYLEQIVNQATMVKDNLKPLFKRLAKGRKSDGFLLDMENLTRTALKSFPRPESTLYNMLINKLSVVCPGDSPSALEALSDAVNGQRLRGKEDMECSLCGSKGAKKCTGCDGKAYYCSVDCQKLHRPTHKMFCKPEQ